MDEDSLIYLSILSAAHEVEIELKGIQIRPKVITVTAEEGQTARAKRRWFLNATVTDISEWLSSRLFA